MRSPYYCDQPVARRCELTTYGKRKPIAASGHAYINNREYTNLNMNLSSNLSWQSVDRDTYGAGSLSQEHALNMTVRHATGEQQGAQNAAAHNLSGTAQRHNHWQAGESKEKGHITRAHGQTKKCNGHHPRAIECRADNHAQTQQARNRGKTMSSYTSTITTTIQTAPAVPAQRSHNQACLWKVPSERQAAGKRGERAGIIGQRRQYIVDLQPRELAHLKRVEIRPSQHNNHLNKKC